MKRLSNRAIGGGLAAIVGIGWVCVSVCTESHRDQARMPIDRGTNKPTDTPDKPEAVAAKQSVRLRTGHTPNDEKSPDPLSADDRIRIDQAMAAFEKRLLQMEKASAAVLDSREESHKHYIHMALNGPTPAELKQERDNAIRGAGLTSSTALRCLQEALGAKADEFRVPEGAVCRVLMLILDHSRTKPLVEYSVIGVADRSHLRLEDGRWPVPPKILPTTTSGGAWPGTQWRFSHLIELE